MSVDVEKTLRIHLQNVLFSNNETTTATLPALIHCEKYELTR